MKKIILSILVIFLLSGCTISGNSNTKTFNTERITEMDFRFPVVERYLGRIDGESENFVYDVRFKNNQDKPVKILKAKTSCACLIATIDETPILSVVKDLDIVFKPDQTKILKIDYIPKLRPHGSIGPFSEFITFQTDNQNNQLITLKLSGEIK